MENRRFWRYSGDLIVRIFLDSEDLIVWIFLDFIRCFMAVNIELVNSCKLGNVVN